MCSACPRAPHRTATIRGWRSVNGLSCFWKVRVFGFHVAPCPRSGSNLGTEGATLLVYWTLDFPCSIAHNITLAPWNLTYIGQENLRPQFGIIMMHLYRSYVVRSDFCCLLSCCYSPVCEMITGPNAFQTGLRLGLLISSSALRSSSEAFLEVAVIPTTDLFPTAPTPCTLMFYILLGLYFALYMLCKDWSCYSACSRHLPRTEFCHVSSVSGTRQTYGPLAMPG